MKKKSILFCKFKYFYYVCLCNKKNMKRIITILILILSSFFAKSQYRWDYGGVLGTSNYLGEIGGTGAKSKGFLGDLNFDKTKATIGGFARFKIHPLLSAKVALTNYTIAGADSLAKGVRALRNLSFKTNITELSAILQFYFFSINDLGNSYKARNDLRFYIFGGISGFYYNPKAFYDDGGGGKWYTLQPLHTEGKENQYSRFSWGIPGGGGIYFTLGKAYRFGWEIGANKTFTDYLDDVSAKYANPATDFNDLSPENKVVAIALSNRFTVNPKDPLSSENEGNYSSGNPRGSPKKSNDYFIYTTFNASYVMRGSSSFYKSKYASVFGKRYTKRRKTRAKF